MKEVTLRECWNCPEIVEERLMTLVYYAEVDAHKMTCRACADWYYQDIADSMASEREAEIRNEEALYKYELPRYRESRARVAIYEDDQSEEHRVLCEIHASERAGQGEQLTIFDSTSDDCQDCAEERVNA